MDTSIDPARRFPTAHRRAVAAALGVSTATAAALVAAHLWGQLDPDVELEHDMGMLMRARQAIAQERPVALRELMGTGWDRARFLPSPASRSSVEAAAGLPVRMSDTHGTSDGAVVVVFDKGTTVRVVALPDDLFRGEAATHGPDATVTPEGGADGWLVLPASP